MLDIGTIHRREYEVDATRLSKAPPGLREDAAKDGPPVVIAQAPGRILFLGDHGDPFSGLYLLAAIDRSVSVAVSARKDSSFRFYAADLSERKRTTFVSLKYKREDRWSNYVKVAIQVFVDLGLSFKGLDFTIAGNIPLNVGLAASSAIEVAAASALRTFLKAKISDKELAKRLAAVHEIYFSKKASIADYLVGFMTKKDQFFVIDEATLEMTKIKSPFGDCKFIFIDSRVPRLEVESELESRKEDVKTALEMLSGGREKANLREFAALDLIESLGNLPEEIRRRSLHVVQEIRWVLEAKECLLAGDVLAFSRIIFHSHESLRDLYEVSCPEIDWMVKRAQETEGTFGARMTGQAFGGCTYTIIKNEAVAEYRERLDEYERIFGFRPIIYEFKLSAGSNLSAEKTSGDNEKGRSEA